MINILSLYIIYLLVLVKTDLHLNEIINTTIIVYLYLLEYHIWTIFDTNQPYDVNNYQECYKQFSYQDIFIHILGYLKSLLITQIKFIIKQIWILTERFDQILY